MPGQTFGTYPERFCQSGSGLTCVNFRGMCRIPIYNKVWHGNGQGALSIRPFGIPLADRFRPIGFVSGLIFCLNVKN